ncbi:MAG: N-acetylmuramoyl-L-alanine amidase [Pseudomonadota bacterium]
MWARQRVCRALVPALISLVWAIQSWAQPVPEVVGVSHGAGGESVRLTLHFSEPPAFSIFTLTNPNRLVLDFPAMNWDLPEGSFEDVPYVAKGRFGLFRADRARMVLELAEPVAVDRAYVSTPEEDVPARLVLDLSLSTQAAFDARAGAPEMARWQGTPPEVPAPVAGDIVIALDAGHGGVDPGASFEGVTEKAVTLTFAKELAAELDQRPGYQAYLIRDTDVFVPLAERVERAHRAKAHVLISIHIDQLEEGVASGISIYRLSEKATDAAAAALAERENRVDLLAGIDLGGQDDDLTMVLIELAQRGTKVESAKLANAMLATLTGQVRLLRSRPLREANFRVLKAPDIPSILLELGFLNSGADRARFADPEWRALTASLVADGIARWRAEASPGFLTPR